MIGRSFRKHFLSVIITTLLLAFASYCQAAVRTEVEIPDIPGYITMKCDFHIHTVFSDGSVWPDVRPEEAWQEGLDAIAITDHVESHRANVSADYTKSYETALSRAKSLNLIIVRGAEITRGMPPGHINAIFLKDGAPLNTKEYRDAIKAAADQGAFIFWNHPPTTWHPEHTELLEKGWLHGIEVVNGDRYQPEAHKWCLEKNLTMMSNSDIHSPIGLYYDPRDRQEHRPMTLVFAKEKTEEAIKEALLAHRTACYYGDTLVGEEKYLKPIFDASIKIINPDVAIKGTGSVNVQIQNKSEVSFELVSNAELNEISVPKEITLYPDKTVLLRVRGKSEELSGKKEISIPYKVKNLMAAPDKGLPVEIKLTVTFISSKE